MMGDRRLAISAGMLRRASRPEAVRLAAAAGFDALGVRFDLDPPSGAELRAVRTMLDDTEMAVLDLEVVRIQPGDDAEDARRLSAWGAEVGAEFLLVVSEDPDRSRTCERFAETCEIAADRGMRTVLEFMRFSSVPTLADALGMLATAGFAGAGVLVDPLHLARSGDAPGAMAGVDPALLPYAQLCDAPATCPGGTGSLAEEASKGRRMPGDGELPLGELLAALPPTATLSVEVLSEAWDARRPQETARAAMDTTRALLASCARAEP